MASLYPDTHPEAERILIESLRRVPVWRKIQLVGQMNEMVRDLAFSGLRQGHPKASPELLRRMLANQILGEALAEKVYGHVPADRPEGNSYIR
jgi:hypothetical protein